VLHPYPYSLIEKEFLSLALAICSVCHACQSSTQLASTFISLAFSLARSLAFSCSGQMRDRNAQHERRGIWGRDSVEKCYSKGFEWVAKPCVASSLPSLVSTSPPSTSTFRMDGSCVSFRIAAPHFHFMFCVKRPLPFSFHHQSCSLAHNRSYNLCSLPPVTRHYKQGRAADNLRSESTPPPPQTLPPFTRALSSAQGGGDYSPR